MTSHSDPTSGRSTTPIVMAAVVVLVVLVGAVAFALTRGDDDVVTPSPVPPATVPDAGADDGGDADDGDPSPTLPPELAGEVRDVEIEGDVLPRFDPDAGPDPALGQRPPTIVAEDANGTVHTISADIDGRVLVVFLAHWCPACNVEVPHLVELDEEGRIPDDVTVYGVLTGTHPDRPGFPPSQWVADFGWPWVAVADGVDFAVDPPQWAAATAYGLPGYPYAVLVDGGVVADRWVGEIGKDAVADRLAS